MGSTSARRSSRMCACVCVCVCVCVLEACAGLVRSCISLSCGPGAASDVRQSAVVGRSFLAIFLLYALQGPDSKPCSGFVELPRAQFGSLCGFVNLHYEYILFFSFLSFLKFDKQNWYQEHRTWCGK